MHVRSLARLAAALSVLAFASARAEDRLRLDGRVDDRPARFVLDTGLSFPLAALPDGARRLGLTVAKPPPDLPGAADLFDGLSSPHRIFLPPNNVEPNGVFALFKTSPEGIEPDFDALVGWSVLRGGALYYAPGRGVRRIERQIALDLNGGQVFPLIDESVAVLDAGEAGAPLRVMLDTGGNAGVQLSPALWNAWLAEHPNQPTTPLNQYSPASGTQVVPQGFAPTLRIGRLLLRNVLVSPRPVARQPGEIQAAAILSLDVFANQDLYLDGPGKRAVILPALGPSAVVYNRLGASFTSPDLAAKVASGGPAARAGLQDGDVLLKIDGLSPGDYLAKTTARPVWAQPVGTVMVLTLKRGVDQIERRVALEDWLGQAR
jgi:hypothetical protein